MSRTKLSSDQSGRIRVMIAEDHEVVRHAMRDIFHMSERFIVVTEASTSLEALELFKADPVDLVLLDLFLRDGSAFHLIHEIHQHQHSSDIIIFSATLSNEILVKAMVAGASGYITKDTPLADIIALLEQYKPGELMMSSSMMALLAHLLIEQYQALSQQNEILSARLQELTQTGAIQNTPQAKARDAQVFSLPANILTPQEEKIFQLLRRGDSNKQIAAQLSISRFTVGKHVQNIFRKLGATNRTQAVSHTAFEGGNQIL
ncbi:MAG TPA: response regulator transcription factor [Ktedonosporobacter sp.]|nr:response regulator transcription factor [Ktedonosporobacter sp.]